MFVFRNNNEINIFKKNSILLNTNGCSSLECKMETPSGYIKLQRFVVRMFMISHRFSSQ